MVTSIIHESPRLIALGLPSPCRRISMNVRDKSVQQRYLLSELPDMDVYIHGNRREARPRWCNLGVIRKSVDDMTTRPSRLLHRGNLGSGGNAAGPRWRGRPSRSRGGDREVGGSPRGRVGHPRHVAAEATRCSRGPAVKRPDIATASVAVDAAQPQRLQPARVVEQLSNQDDGVQATEEVSSIGDGFGPRLARLRDRPGGLPVVSRTVGDHDRQCVHLGPLPGRVRRGHGDVLATHPGDHTLVDERVVHRHLVADAKLLKRATLRSPLGRAAGRENRCGAATTT
jgi:hypothetical protein